MFKLRRRTVAETAATDQPFCAMCGTTTRVDAASGRCALGHRVIAPGVLPVAAAVVEEHAVAYEATAELPVDDISAPVAAGEGLYEAYQSADAAGRNVTWDDVVAPAVDGPTSVYDDYLTWDEPTSGFSSLDVDTSELPVAEEVVAAAPLTASDLLDELDDDNAYVRQRTVGTLGATVAITGMLAAAIAILPI